MTVGAQLRAAKVLPKLTLVLETLIRSASSVMYIAMFLMLVMYIFAIVGVSIFNKNDPWHFGDLGTGMLSLWRISTLEDWTDIMYFNQFGVSATSLCRWVTQLTVAAGSAKAGATTRAPRVALRASTRRLVGLPCSTFRALYSSAASFC